MAKRLELMPKGFSCSLIYCPSGLFLFDGELCFKTGYGNCESFIVDGGEAFWGKTSSELERLNLIVQPLKAVWTNED